MTSLKARDLPPGKARELIPIIGGAAQLSDEELDADEQWHAFKF